MRSINPATNTLVREYAPHGPAEIDDILRSVHGAWTAWKETAFKERARLLRNAADLLLAERDLCAALITAEMGKPITESRGEVEKCALACRYFADNAERFLNDELVNTVFQKSLVTFQPLGVILAVMPWNFPFWQVWRFIAPALMAGNAGVLKHASNVCGCSLKIEEIVRKAGFPADLFRSLLIPAEAVAGVIASPLVRGVTLTGSEPAGRAVAEQAGKELKKSVLELGGSDPFIVLEDADLDECVRAAVRSRCLNAGQVCISAKRFIAVESVAGPFLDRMATQMGSLIVGDPADEKTQLGPMARPDLLDEIHSQVERSIGRGARLVTGGHRLERPGNYYAPTILTEVTRDMAVFREETFGPVAAVITVKNEAEAVAAANDTDYGLGASVWTRDLARGEQIARKIDAGMVFVNSMTASYPALPFGGVKRSGYGRELSHHGLREFVNIKTIGLR
ncbi:MAG: NAD-dependent succinate-semialdehyde dehydrogenase [Thermodesulfobacteriota bacterium]